MVLIFIRFYFIYEVIILLPNRLPCEKFVFQTFFQAFCSRNEYKIFLWNLANHRNVKNSNIFIFMI